MKNRISYMAGRMGYTILPTWRVAALPLTTCLRQIFASRHITTVIDVGANKGQYHDYLRNQVGYDGRIVSFEPVPELAALLQTRAKPDKNWTVRGCALGSAVGELTLNIMVSSVFSSFLQPLRGTAYDADNMVARAETVAVSTLDVEFQDPEMLRAAYLKLDTQGFDLEVLRGAPVAGRLIPALQSEVSFQPIYEKMPNYIESIAEFARYGFAVADMFLVNPGEVGIAVEFDCIMVRNETAAGAF